MEIRHEYTDKTKLIDWLLTTKILIIEHTWPVMKDPEARNLGYGITGDLCILIEKHLKKIEEVL